MHCNGSQTIHQVRSSGEPGESARSSRRPARSPGSAEAHGPTPLKARSPTGPTYSAPTYSTDPAAGACGATQCGRLPTIDAPRISATTPHLPWFDAHPTNVVVREDAIMTPLSRFFEQRILGDGRTALLGQEINKSAVDDSLAERQASLTAEITNLQQRQTKLISELEQYESSGDDDFDQAWRSGIQDRFRNILAEQRKKSYQLAELTQQSQSRPTTNPALLES